MQGLEQPSLRYIQSVADALYSAYEDDIGFRGATGETLAGVALFVTMLLHEISERAQRLGGTGITYDELMRLFVVLLDVTPQF